MLAIKRLIPNLFTAGNLVGGILAIIFTLNGRIDVAPYFILISAVFDFLDGFVARLLKVQSELGKQLDSLADMVTFGVAPGIILLVLLDIPNGLNDLSWIQGTHESMRELHYWPSCANTDLYLNREFLIQNDIIYNGDAIKKISLYNDSSFSKWPSLFALLIPIFALFRLAKFNLDTRQTDSFIGLPTPAMTIFVSAIPLIIFGNSGTLFSENSSVLFLLNPYFLLSSTIILSILMVSEIPLFALKFKSFKWKGNEVRYIFLTISAILLATLFVWALPLIIVLYIVLSVIINLIKKPSTNEI